MAKNTAGRSVGLEIDTGAVRAVEMAGKVDASKLVGLGSINLPEEVVKDGLVLEPKVVGSALKELWKTAGLRERSVLLGVSNQGVLVRHITIPKVPSDKIKNVVMFQAEDLLPISLNNVVLDYLVLGEIKGSGEAEVELEILLVAARRDMLSNFLEALSIANLEPLDIDVSSMAMIRLLPQKAMNITVAMVNIANGLNSILISGEGKPRLARLGTVNINNLAEDLGSSLEDVLNGNQFNDESAFKVMENWISRQAAEIRSSITYYQDQTESSRVEGVLLSGRGALFGDIAARLENYLNLPVRIFNPLEAYAPSKRRLLKSDNEAIEYTVSAGLALRGLEG